MTSDDRRQEQDGGRIRTRGRTRENGGKSGRSRAGRRPRRFRAETRGRFRSGVSSSAATASCGSPAARARVADDLAVVARQRRDDHLALGALARGGDRAVGGRAVRIRRRARRTAPPADRRARRPVRAPPPRRAGSRVRAAGRCRDSRRRAAPRAPSSLTPVTPAGGADASRKKSSSRSMSPRPLAQRRQVDAVHVQAVEQVAAERARRPRPPADRRWSRRRSARRRVRTSFSPMRRTSPASSARSSLACTPAGIVPISSRNSVPPLACSIRPARAAGRAGERAAGVAEQLVLEQRVGQRGAVQRDERLVGARAARRAARARRAPCPCRSRR